MNPLQKEKLIIDLITNDLVLSKLLYGLYQLDIDANSYSIYLSRWIFRLMDLQVHSASEKALYDFYTQQTFRAQKVSLQEGYAPMQQLATEIYKALYERFGEDTGK